MMRRAVSRFGLLAVSAVLCGCGSSGIEGGMPSETDSGSFSEKFPDPMAGHKILANPSPKAVFNDPMRLGASPTMKPSKAGKK